MCEAELSNPMYEIHTGDSDAQAQAKKNNCISTKGVGRVAPTAWKDAGCVNKNLKGVLMPDGQAGQNPATTGYLQYAALLATYHLTANRYPDTTNTLPMTCVKFSCGT